jgi:hypothetical protein
MATKRPAKPGRTPLQEASDPATDPERLLELAWHVKEDVQRAARRNPSVPEDAWREVLLHGWPEAWANPMAPFYLLAWTPHEDDPFTLAQAARVAAQVLWGNPEQCSPEGKALIAAKIEEWWATSELADDMVGFLGWWAEAKGIHSPENREAVRILLLCVRTVSHPTDEDRQALDLLEAWAAGGQDRRKEAEALAESQAVKDVVEFARDPSDSPRCAIYEVLEVVASDKEGREREEARAEHQRLLADLIRRERPLPPVVD